LGERVAPRCSFAQSVLLVVKRRHGARTEGKAALADHGLLDLTKVISEYRVDTLICGGISHAEKEFLTSRHVEIIDNVVGSVDELLEALGDGTLCSGFGLNSSDKRVQGEKELPRVRPPVQSPASDTGLSPDSGAIDCLACRDRNCLSGKPCDFFRISGGTDRVDRDSEKMLEAALDISCEDERTLCRLSELIYFCLEMHYDRIGVAYCQDLQEPAEILVRVLRRYFTVFPVCCKIGGLAVSDPLDGPPSETGRTHSIACNPRGQAEALNRLKTDLNVLVGICMGADCVFSGLSQAPVTTLFVKDKSLANNPIGAVYSDYYLNEAIHASTRGPHRDFNQGI